jgi:hypothetical protein
MDNHFTARELANGDKIILSCGIYVVTDVEQSDTIPENILLHHADGAFECTPDCRFVSVGPTTFKPLV